MFKSVGKVSDFAIEQKDLDIFADRAVEIGSYSFHFTPAGAKAPMKDHGSYLNYWKKAVGRLVEDLSRRHRQLRAHAWPRVHVAGFQEVVTSI